MKRDEETGTSAERSVAGKRALQVLFLSHLRQSAPHPHPKEVTGGVRRCGSLMIAVKRLHYFCSLRRIKVPKEGPRRRLITRACLVCLLSVHSCLMIRRSPGFLCRFTAARMPRGSPLLRPNYSAGRSGLLVSVCPTPAAFKCQEEALSYTTTPEHLRLGDTCCFFMEMNQTFG